MNDAPHINQPDPNSSISMSAASDVAEEQLTLIQTLEEFIPSETYTEDDLAPHGYLRQAWNKACRDASAGRIASKKFVGGKGGNLATMVRQDAELWIFSPGKNILLNNLEQRVQAKQIRVQAEQARLQEEQVELASMNIRKLNAVNILNNLGR